MPVATVVIAVTTVCCLFVFAGSNSIYIPECMAVEKRNDVAVTE